jgi:hypothetical protein
MKSDHKLFDKNFDHTTRYDDRDDKTTHFLTVRYSFFTVTIYYTDVDSASSLIYIAGQILTSPAIYCSEKTTLANAIKLAEKQLIEYAKEFVILSELKLSD